MKLTLLGIEADRSKLQDIASRIAALGHDVRYLSFTDAPPLVQRDDGAAGTNGLILHCWTSASVANEAHAFQDDAVAAKEAGLYRGLVCDDVEVPAAILGATDFRLGDDLHSVTHELEQHFARAQMRNTAGLAWIRAQLAQIVVRLKVIDRRWKLTAAAVLFVGVVSFVGDAFSLWDRWATLPTEQQQSEWNMIVAGEDCDAFAAYIERHGVDAPFAADARYRLDRVREVAGPAEPELVPIVFPIPLSEREFPDDVAGTADAMSRANALAAAACAPSFAALGRTGEEPTAEINGVARCSPSGLGVRCSATATARCMTARPTVRRVCTQGKDIGLR